MQGFGIMYIYAQILKEWLVVKLNFKDGKEQNQDYPHNPLS